MQPRVVSTDNVLTCLKTRMLTIEACTHAGDDDGGIDI